MKVIIYRGQNKFTVDNISIPDTKSVSDLIKSQGSAYSLSASELENYNFQITSTRGAINENDIIDINEDIAREIEEGIYWKLESVN